MIGEKKRITDYYYIRYFINIIYTKKLLKQYYNNKIINKINNEFKNCIIYCADGHIPCGGLADRMFGIMNLYALCTIKHVPFYIYFESPYSLNNFLEPNSYNWIINKNYITYNKKESMPRCLLGGAQRLPKWAVSLKKNKQIHVYCNFKNLDYINKKYKSNFTYYKLFHELFKFNDSFLKRFKEIRLMFPNEYVGLQVRCLNAFGDFPDAISNSLTKQQRDKLVNLCEDKINEIYIRTNLPILLTTDSQKLIDILKERKKINNCLMTVPGEITHTDIIKSNNDFEKHLKTYIDLFLLAEAKELFQINNKYIYKSGFSTLAATLSNKKINFI